MLAVLISSQVFLPAAGQQYDSYAIPPVDTSIPTGELGAGVAEEEMMRLGVSQAADGQAKVIADAAEVIGEVLPDYGDAEGEYVVVNESQYQRIYGDGVPYAYLVRPARGPTCGGTSVDILGENFHGRESILCRFGTNVTVPGTFSLVNVTFDDPDPMPENHLDPGPDDGTQRVTCATPALKAGEYLLEVSFDGGKHYTNEGLVYEYYDPVVTSVSPSSGPLHENTTVVVRGGDSGFAGVASWRCRFGDQSTTEGVVSSDGQTLTCVTDTEQVTASTGVAAYFDVTPDTDGDGEFDTSPVRAPQVFIFYDSAEVYAVSPATRQVTTANHPFTTHSQAQVSSPVAGGIQVALSGAGLGLTSNLTTYVIRVGDQVVPANLDGDNNIIFTTPSAQDAGVLATRAIDIGSVEGLSKSGGALRGDASLIENAVFLTQAGISGQKGSLTLAIEEHRRLQHFRVEFEALMGLAGSDRHKGMGLGFSVAEVDGDVAASTVADPFGYEGFGSGLRVLFRTRSSKSIEVMYRNKLVAQVVNVDLRLGVWVPVSIEVSFEGHVSVCFNLECHVEGLLLDDWSWGYGYGFGFGARTTASALDAHAIANINIRSGELGTSAETPVYLSFNGQHFEPLFRLPAPLGYDEAVGVTGAAALDGPEVRLELRSREVCGSNETNASISGNDNGSSTTCITVYENVTVFPCVSVVLTTTADVEAGSIGPFLVRDHDELPLQCHDAPNASCTIEVCSRDLEITAATSDAWFFTATIEGRGGVLPVEYTLADDASADGHQMWPSRMSTETYDAYQRFQIRGMACYDVELSTSDLSIDSEAASAAPEGAFVVLGSGPVPANCTVSGGSCNVTVCGSELIIAAHDADGWSFSARVDGMLIVPAILDLVPVNTSAQHGPSVNPPSFSPVRLDTDEHASRAVFDLDSLGIEAGDAHNDEFHGHHLMLEDGTSSVAVPLDPDVCLTLEFTTCSSVEAINATSSATFHVSGWGPLPSSCSAVHDQGCSIDVCGRRRVSIFASATGNASVDEDAWCFRLSVDDLILTPGRVASPTTAAVEIPTTSGTLSPADPWWLAAASSASPENQAAISQGETTHDLYHEYAIGCHLVTLTTGSAAGDESTGPYTIEGFGTIPTDCMQTTGSSCTIGVCTDHVTVVPHTLDEWNYLLYVGDDPAHVEAMLTLPDTYVETLANGTAIGSAHTIIHHLQNVTNATAGDDATTQTSRFPCVNITLVTSDGTHDGSSGPFSVEGYGELPSSCHQFSGTSSCTIELCDVEWLEITAGTTDAWVFTVFIEFGDVGRGGIVPNDWRIADGTWHSHQQYPSRMDTSNYDEYQRYKIHGVHCTDVTFSTDTQAFSNTDGTIIVEGYGAIPSACTNWSSCVVPVCTETLIVTATSADAWFFHVSVNDSLLLPSDGTYDTTTTTSGNVTTTALSEDLSYHPLKMDNDQFASRLEFDHVHDAGMGAYASPAFGDLNGGCVDVVFQTCPASEDPNAASSGPFHIDGWGKLPTACHNNAGGECTVQVCGLKTIKLFAGIDDGWCFRLSVGGDVLSPSSKLPNTHGAFTADPWWLEVEPGTGNSNDYYQEYNIGCPRISFTTLLDSGANSAGPFTIDGYGGIAENCMSTTGASCTLAVCTDNGRVTLRGETGDAWGYRAILSGIDVIPVEAVPGSSGDAKIYWLDNDDNDISHTFALNCTLATVQTGDASGCESAGPILVDGYGTLPSKCTSELGKICTIAMCASDDYLVIASNTTDAWCFMAYNPKVDDTGSVEYDVLELVSATAMDRPIEEFPDLSYHWVDTDQYHVHATFRLLAEPDPPLEPVTVRYYTPPHITSVYPGGGDVRGGANVTVRGTFFTGVNRCRFGDQTVFKLAHESVAVPPTCGAVLDEYADACLVTRENTGEVCLENPLPINFACCEKAWQALNWGCEDKSVRCDINMSTFFYENCLADVALYETRVYCTVPDLIALPLGETTVAVSINGRDFHPSADVKYFLYDKTQSSMSATYPLSIDGGGGAEVTLYGNNIRPFTVELIETSVVWVGNDESEAVAVPVIWDVLEGALTFVAPPMQGGHTNVALAFNTQDRHVLGTVLYLGPSAEEAISPPFSLSIGKNFITVVGAGFQEARVYNETDCLFGAAVVRSDVVDDFIATCSSPDYLRAGASLSFDLQTFDGSFSVGQSGVVNTVEYLHEYTYSPFASIFEVVEYESLNRPSAWGYSYDTAVTGRDVVIAQLSSSRVGSIDTAYGSYAKLWDGPFWNGMITLDMLVKSDGVAGVAFRFVDVFNFYAFEIHPASVDGPAFRRLIRVVDGRMTILGQDEPSDGDLNGWHSVVLTARAMTVKVIWEKLELFEHVGLGVAEPVAGSTVALSAWSMPGAYFDELKIYTDPYGAAGRSGYRITELDVLYSVYILGNAEWQQDVYGTNEVSLTQNSLLATRVGSLLINATAYHPAVVFTATFDVRVEKNGNGVCFFFAPTPDTTRVHDEGIKNSGFSMVFKASGVVQAYWRSRNVFETSVVYVPGDFLESGVRFRALSQEAAFAGEVVIDVRVQGVWFEDVVDLAQYDPPYQPDESWLFGWGASLEMATDNSGQGVRDIKIDTNFATGIDWTVPLRLTMNGRDLVPVSGASEAGSSDTLVDILYTHFRVTDVAPTSVATGSSELINVTTSLAGGRASGLVTTLESYTFACVFMDFDLADVERGRTVAEMDLATFVLSCPVVPTIRHTRCLLKIEIQTVDGDILDTNTLDFRYLGATIEILNPTMGSVAGGTDLAVRGVFEFGFSFTCRFSRIDSSPNGTVVTTPGTATAVFADVLESLQWDYQETQLDNTFGGVRCITPAQDAPGIGLVQVSLNGKDFSPPAEFEYHPVPSISSFFPTSCSSEGNCSVAISGTNFHQSVNSEFRCRFGSDIRDGTRLSETDYVCLSPAFETAGVIQEDLRPLDSIGEKEAAGEFRIAGTAVLDDSSGFYSSSAFKFLPELSTGGGVLEIDPDEPLDVECAEPATTAVAVLGPALDFRNKYVIEVEFLSDAPPGFFYGIVPHDGLDISLGSAQTTNAYLYKADGEFLFADTTVGDHNGIPAVNYTAIPTGHVAWLRYEYGSVSFEVGDTRYEEVGSTVTVPDGALSTDPVVGYPFYFVVGQDAVPNTNAGVTEGFHVKVVEVEVLSNYSAVTITPDLPYQYGNVHFSPFNFRPFQRITLSGDVWVGMSARRLVDPLDVKTVADGFRIIVVDPRLLEDEDDLETTSGPKFAMARVVTYPTDSVLEITTTLDNVPTDATVSLPSLTASGWRSFTFSLDDDGTLCIQLQPNPRECRSVDTSTVSSLAASGGTLALQAFTGSVFAQHSFRYLYGQLVPPRNLTELPVSLSLNDQDYFPASETFRLFGVGPSVLTVIDPDVGIFGETIRLWGRNLAGGSNYTCVFSYDDGTGRVEIVQDAVYDEPSVLPPASVTNYDVSNVEPGPVRCNVPLESQISSAIELASIAVDITMNEQDLTGTILTFDIVAANNITGIFPHTGPISGDTALAVAQDLNIESTPLAQIFCRFNVESTLAQHDVQAYAVVGVDVDDDGTTDRYDVMCRTPGNIFNDTTISHLVSVQLTINGQTFTGDIAGNPINRFLYYPEPRVTLVTPPQGYLDANNTIEIRGDNLLFGFASEYQCKFVGTGYEVVIVAEKQVDHVSCVTPVWPTAETVGVFVTPNSQQFDVSSVNGSTADSDFTYYRKPTGILGPDPNFGPTSGETDVRFLADEFVIGNDVKCRFTARDGNVDIIPGLLDPSLGSIDCITPDAAIDGNASIQIALFGDPDDYVNVSRPFRYVFDPILGAFAYNGGFTSRSTRVVISFVNGVDPNDFVDTVCNFTHTGRSDGVGTFRGGSLTVPANVTNASLSCQAPFLTDFGVSVVDSIVCQVDDAFVCSDPRLIHYTHGSVSVDDGLGAIKLAGQTSNQGDVEVAGGVSFFANETSACPNQFQMTAEVYPGDIGTGVSLSFGTGYVTKEYDHRQYPLLDDALVVFLDYNNDKVQVGIDGVLLFDGMSLVPLKSRAWTLLRMSVIDKTLTVKGGVHDLIEPITLADSWPSPVVSSSECHYGVDGIVYHATDSFAIKAVNFYGYVVSFEHDFTVKLEHFPNFVSNELVFHMSPDLVINHIFPVAGPTTGGTLVRFDCHHVSDFWGEVQCYFGDSEVEATWDSATSSVYCATPPLPANTSDDYSAHTVPVRLLVNKQHFVPIYTAEALEFTYYHAPTVPTVSPRSSPKMGGTTLLINVTGLAMTDWLTPSSMAVIHRHWVTNLITGASVPPEPQRGSNDNGMRLQCQFGDDITIDAFFVTLYNDSASTVLITCETPDVRSLDSEPNATSGAGPLNVAFSLVLNENPGQVDQRIVSGTFTFYDAPEGMTLVSTAAALTPTPGTTVAITPVVFDDGTDVYCEIGTRIVTATRVDATTIECEIPNAAECGASNIQSFDSSQTELDGDAGAGGAGGIALRGMATFEGSGGAGTGIHLTANSPVTEGGAVDSGQYGSLTVTPPEVAAPFASFKVEFDLTIVPRADGVTDLVGSDGVSFFFGEADETAFGEGGYGLGIRVLFRTYTTKRIETYADGEELSSVYVGEECTTIYIPERELGEWQWRDCTPYNKIRTGTNHVIILWQDNHLTVTFDNQVMANAIAAPLPVPPAKDWTFSIAARSGAALPDGHQVDNLIIETGAVVAEQQVPVYVLLNGQQRHLAGQIVYS